MRYVPVTLTLRGCVVTREKRLMVGVALGLALVLAVGGGWYLWSDTGKRWRFDDKLATYCDGLIPQAESRPFTGRRTDSGELWEDANGRGQNRYCRIGDITLLVGLAPATDVGSEEGGPSTVEQLNASVPAYPPVPLGGGWRGFTDAVKSAVVLPCTNRNASVLVTAEDGEGDHGDLRRARQAAELVASVAVKAARYWSCSAAGGGRIPPLSDLGVVAETGSASGSCRGVPLRTYNIVPFMETPASGTSPVEYCLLGEHAMLESAYGPYAQRLRRGSDETAVYPGSAGMNDVAAWASAKCPEYGARALFILRRVPLEESDPGYRMPPDEQTEKLALLKGFAEHSAQQHGCTGLQLPPFRIF
ncbi:hypothetical protein OG864_02035 [Streptomyces sp. NBC_00124]|uniref:hypothetical protein n=1 Tax=Streptomyces sp. NBC_00124 TaxID=2975662 RepID=UPI0022573289|nr:hypothetical protein [Streptomyces sp. NBC_00124]MCX5357537.1 hypothetical protein [Streptomyces sp. NBC_00124]